MPPTWPRLGEITAPTLVMIGRLDVDDIQAIHEPLVKIIPNARLVWLDDVAHLPQLQGDRKTLDEIASFVDAIP
jgi:pimeloyl-ACP methyl ester carboxylesterase